MTFKINKESSKNKKTLLAKEFELLVKELKESGLEVRENSEETETNKTTVYFCFSKKKKEG